MGYILLDLDHPAPGILGSVRTQGHEPMAVVENSPGKLQAWIRVSNKPLPPLLATRISRRLAQLYAADRASADGRHLDSPIVSRNAASTTVWLLGRN